MSDRYTDALRTLLDRAKNFAIEAKHGHIHTNHLLRAMLTKPTKDLMVIRCVLQEYKLTAEILLTNLAAREEQGNDTNSNPAPSGHSKKALEYAMQEAIGSGAGLIGVEHLLIGLILTHEGTAGVMFADVGLTAEMVRQSISFQLYNDTSIEAVMPGEITISIETVDDRSLDRLFHVARLLANQMDVVSLTLHGCNTDTIEQTVAMVRAVKEAGLDPATK